jgi:hypothetical protein
MLGNSYYLSPPRVLSLWPSHVVMFFPLFFVMRFSLFASYIYIYNVQLTFSYSHFVIFIL